jgi:Fe-S-cluster containining protein
MPPDPEPWQLWSEAAQRPEVAARLRDALDEIDRRVNESGFTCQQSGRCCRFESFGHRLYMTGLEIAWFRSLAGDPQTPASTGSITLPVIHAKRDGCPYQIDGMCSVHQSRPFACRVFFCQEGSDDWQSEQYETFQSTMKNLHEKLGLPYRYMEWRSGLADAQAHGL